MSEYISENVEVKLDYETRDRAIFATKVFCRFCEEHKIKTCLWEKSPVWNEYVEGRIDEAELSRSAEVNVRDFVKIFSDSKNLETPVVDVLHEDQKTRRIRIANKIYRNACTKSGLDHCFFKNFAAWSDYVNGMIDEDAFIESAVFEVLKIKRNADVEKL